MPLILCPRCPHCHEQSQIEMKPEEIQRMNSGMPIQQALKDWPPEQREMLITGIHPKCWEEMMAEDDDDTPLDGRMDLL